LAGRCDRARGRASPFEETRAGCRGAVAPVQRWREEATKAGRTIARIAVAYEAGRDGFWLARWLQERSIEAFVIHPNSIPVKREHRRPKTDRLDVNLLKRGFLGWLRGEPGHCTMAAIPTLEAEDARRPNREHEMLVGERSRIINRMKSALARFGIRNFKPHLRQAPERLAVLRTPEGIALPPNSIAELRRDMARLQLVKEQIAEIEQTRLERLRQAPAEPAQVMLATLARVVGLGVETADVLVHELLVRNLRDRRAVARGACPRAGQRPDPGAASLEPPTRAARVAARRAWRAPAMPGYVVPSCSWRGGL